MCLCNKDINVNFFFSHRILPQLQQGCQQGTQLVQLSEGDVHPHAQVRRHVPAQADHHFQSVKHYHNSSPVFLINSLLFVIFFLRFRLV